MVKVKNVANLFGAPQETLSYNYCKNRKNKNINFGIRQYRYEYRVHVTNDIKSNSAVQNT